MLMPKRVVDGFEIVEVQDQTRQPALPRLACAQSRRLLAPCAPVAQAGGGIRLGGAAASLVEQVGTVPITVALPRQPAGMSAVPRQGCRPGCLPPA